MDRSPTQVDDVVGDIDAAQPVEKLPPLELLVHTANGTDADLAAMIFEDGRRRSEAGIELSLADYLRVLPDLPSREIALDAAIGVCLGRYHATPEERNRRAVIERERHPELASAIDLAMCLDQLMGSPDASKGKDAPAADESHPTDIGPLLEDGSPRYRIRSVMGRGASSTVYEADDKLLSESNRSNRVAIKLFHREQIDSELFDRTVAEARKARSIQHPGVIRILDVGKEGSSAYIVQEHVPSESLEAWLAGRGKDADTRKIVRLMRDVASALGAVHAAGIWHRDLKPANVLVTENDQIKIVDFGSSRLQESDTASEHASTAHGGTLAFMAPEQFNMEQNADSPAADIFSLGAMMFWIFVGRSPHGTSRVDALASLSEGAPRDEMQEALTHTGICTQLQQIVLRALSHHPSDRYSSADSFAADLDAWLAFKPIEWQKPSVLRRSRLLLRRRPVAIALSCLFAGIVTAGAVGWLNAMKAEKLAREHKFAADVASARADAARARADAQEAWKQEAATKLTENFAKFPIMLDEGLKEEVLIGLWIYEWVHGPAVFASPELANKVWLERTNVVAGIQDRIKSKYEANTVSSELLVPPLAMWHIHACNYEQAEEMLAESEAFWLLRIPPSDPWIQDLRELAAAAKLLRRLDEVRQSPNSDGLSIQQQLEPEITTVKGIVAQNKLEFDQGPIAKLLKESLDKVMKQTP